MDIIISLRQFNYWSLYCRKTRYNGLFSHFQPQSHNMLKQMWVVIMNKTISADTFIYDFEKLYVLGQQLSLLSLTKKVLLITQIWIH